MTHHINNKDNEAILTVSGSTVTLFHPDAKTWQVGDEVTSSRFGGVLGEPNSKQIVEILESRPASEGVGWGNVQRPWFLKVRVL